MIRHVNNNDYIDFNLVHGNVNLLGEVKEEKIKMNKYIPENMASLNSGLLN